MKKALHLSCTLFLSLGLIACGDDDPDSSTKTIKRLGTVLVSDTFGTVEASGLFAEFESPVSISEVTGFHGISEDTCEIDDDAEPVSSDEVGASSISAGGAIIVSSPAGTYATLTPRRDEFNDLVYEVDVDLPESVPTGLTVDIPGEEFPAFSGVQMPDIQSVTLTSPQLNSSATLDTQFNWVADANSDTVIFIVVFGTGEFSNIELSCYAIDDGEFTFPVSVQSALDAGFTGNFSVFWRFNYLTEMKDDSLLVTGTVSDSR